jgi:hypothetical protein
MLMILLCNFVFAVNEDYVNPYISSMGARNGQLYKNDGSVVNEVDNVKTLQFQHNFTTEGALDFTTTFDNSVRVLEVEINFDDTVTETLKITKIFENTDYNTLRKSVSLLSNASFVFNDVIYLNEGQQINITCTADTATTIANITITYSNLVR